MTAEQAFPEPMHGCVNAGEDCSDWYEFVKSEWWSDEEDWLEDDKWMEAKDYE